MKNFAKITLVAGLVGIAFQAFAQTPGIDMNNAVGYTLDQRGNVTKSGAGLCWRTGFWTPAMAIAECDPDLVQTPATPAPAAATPATPAPAPKPSAEKVTMAADALFDFDKAVLRQEGMAKLDELATKATEIKLEVIIAVGHTDRLGSDGYNQKLSERRAAAVKEYLVGKGIEANRIYTEGKGKKQPVTGDTCGTSLKKTKKLIECLQPDRRVEIEVIGTK